MANAPSPATGPKCILEPLNLHDQTEYDELLRQRILCGWNNTPETLNSWRDSTDAKKKSLFWIKLASQPDLRIGHVSLDSEAEPPNLEVANPHDKSVLLIASFFILEKHRGGGLGRDVMATLEKLAMEEPYGSPNCKATGIVTLSRRYHDNDEDRARMEALEGVPALPRGQSNEAWYLRMGYEKWQEDQPLYPSRNTSVDVKYFATFLKKKLA